MHTRAPVSGSATGRFWSTLWKRPSNRDKRSSSVLPLLAACLLARCIPFARSFGAMDPRAARDPRWCGDGVEGGDGGGDVMSRSSSPSDIAPFLRRRGRGSTYSYRGADSMIDHVIDLLRVRERTPLLYGLCLSSMESVLTIRVPRHRCDPTRHTHTPQCASDRS